MFVKVARPGMAGPMFTRALSASQFFYRPLASPVQNKFRFDSLYRDKLVEMDGGLVWFELFFLVHRLSELLLTLLYLTEHPF
jgi:hypothetical protein